MNSVSLRVSRNQHKTSWKVSEEFAHVGWSAKQSSFRVVKRHEFQARLHMLGQRADWATQRDPVSERMLSSPPSSSSQHLRNQAQVWSVKSRSSAGQFHPCNRKNQLTMPADSLPNVRADKYSKDVSAALFVPQNKLGTRRRTPLTASFL